MGFSRWTHHPLSGDTVVENESRGDDKKKIFGAIGTQFPSARTRQGSRIQLVMSPPWRHTPSSQDPVDQGKSYHRADTRPTTRQRGRQGPQDPLKGGRPEARARAEQRHRSNQAEPNQASRTPKTEKGLVKRRPCEKDGLAKEGH